MSSQHAFSSKSQAGSNSLRFSLSRAVFVYATLDIDAAYLKRERECGVKEEEKEPCQGKKYRRVFICLLHFVYSYSFQVECCNRVFCKNNPLPRWRKKKLLSTPILVLSCLPFASFIAMKCAEIFIVNSLEE